MAATTDINAVPLTDDEIQGLRAETAARRHVVHFNHAGDSPTPDPVLKVMIDHLHLESEIGAYEAAALREDRLAAVYDSVASLINAQRDEIAIVENATRARDMLFYSMPLQPGDRILTAANEYGSNAIALLQVAQRGISVELIPNDETGALDLDAFRNLLDERVRLVAITHMATNGGMIQPGEGVGRVLDESGSDAVYLLDACQTVGQMPIDVARIGCHALSATSRKYLRGPRGRGFLYVRSELDNRLEPTFLDNHTATWTTADTYELAPGAQRFENWERPTAAVLGFGAAVDYAARIGIDRSWATIAPRAAGLRDRLGAIPGVTIRDLGSERGAIVSFTVANHDPDEVKQVLAVHRINVSASEITSTRYDMEQRGPASVVRASVHYVTTEHECDVLAEQVERLSAAT